MKYLPNEQWKKLPFPENDYRPRFFIELYQELLSANTPTSFHPKIMNVGTYAFEILELISHYKKYSRGKSYIERSLNEFFEYIKNDEIAKEVYKNEISSLYELDIKDLKTNSINKLSLLMRLLLDSNKQEVYWNKIKTDIIENICNTSDDLKEKKRVLDKIKNSSELLSSYMLNKFGTSRYLFNRNEQFIRRNNYRSRVWKEQLRKVLNDFNTKEREFSIFFIIRSKNKIENNIKDLIPLISFKKHYSNYKRNNDFRRFINQIKNQGGADEFYVIKFITKSYNYDTALSKIKEELSTLDLMNVLRDIEISPISLIVTNKISKPHTYHIKSTSIEYYLNNKLFLDLQENRLYDVFNVLNDESTNLLKSSLRYFRIAKQSKSVEQKLLNSWIAIETIYLKQNSSNDDEESIINNIIYYIPFLYNSFSIIRKIRYARELLVVNKIPIPDEVCSKLNISEKSFNENIKVDSIWKIMKDESLFLSLMEINELDGLEHLKYRLTDIYNFIINKDSKSGDKTETILKHFKKTKNLVENQLYRIYGMRNKISHQGHYENINHQLIEHLTDYLMISYSAIAIGKTYLPKLHNGEKFSLLDILDIYEFQFNNILKNIESDEISSIESVFINYKRNL